MTDEPKMKDSGERRTFSTGAVRDRGGFKPRPDLISPHANLREGAWLARGAEKYGLRNYEKGMPISDCVASLTRHLEQYKRGDTDEDHAAAIRTNAGFIIHFEEEIKAGRLPADLDDMPKYATPQLGDTRINPKTEAKETYMYLCERDSDGKLIIPPELMDSESDDDKKEGPPYRINTAEEVDLVPITDSVHIDDDMIVRDNEPHHHRLSRLAPDEAPTFYIAGPMRGHEYLNFPIFDEVADQAREKGYSIISPAEMDREHGIDPIKDPDSVDRAKKADPNLIQTLAQRDCELILNLKKDRGDGLILLPGWSKSTGAQSEVALALWLGLKFRNSLREFEEIAPKRIKYVLFGQGEE